MGFGPPYEIVSLAVFVQTGLGTRFCIDMEKKTIFVFALKKLEEIRKGIITRQHIYSNKQGAAKMLCNEKEESKWASSGQPGWGRKGTYVILGGHLAWVPKMELVHLCVSMLLVYIGPSPIRIVDVSTEMPKSWVWPRPVKFPKKLVGTFQSKLYYCPGLFFTLL